MMKPRLRIFLTIIALSASGVLSAFRADTTKFIKFDGSLKTRFEYATETNMSRFTVRNSRMGLSGNIIEEISYRAQVELSNEGKFEVLDMYTSIKPFKNLSVSLGQMQIPIYNSYQTAPAQMLFANRTFMAKYFVPGTRDIGVLAQYDFKLGSVPAEIDAGAFNASLINKPVWTNSLSWSLRAIVGEMKGLRGSAKIYRYPGVETDFFLWGADLRYGGERFKIEAEFLDRRNLFNDDDLLATCLQGAYSFPVKNAGIFKDVTPALRWDMMGHNVRENGIDVNRLTAGLSFGFTAKPFTSLLRIEYEEYLVADFIPEFTRYDEMDSDKITVELIIIF
jgi:hypothetical protein